MKVVQARSRADLTRHYEIECALAAQLRKAGKAERKDLYRSLYNQLFFVGAGPSPVDNADQSVCS